MRDDLRHAGSADDHSAEYRRKQHVSRHGDRRALHARHQPATAQREGFHEVPGLRAQVHAEAFSEQDRRHHQLRARRQDRNDAAVLPGRLQDPTALSERARGGDDQEVLHPDRAALRVRQPAVQLAAESAAAEPDDPHDGERAARPPAGHDRLHPQQHAVPPAEGAGDRHRPAHRRRQRLPARTARAGHRRPHGDRLQLAERQLRAPHGDRRREMAWIPRRTRIWSWCWTA